MYTNWLVYMVVFFSAFAITLLCTPYVKTLAFKVGAIDNPKKRGIHSVPMPLMGGLAMVLGFFISILIAMPFVVELRTTQVIGFIIGGVIIVIMGILDDIYSLSAKFKFLLQLVVAFIVVMTGTRIDFINWEFFSNIEFLAPIFTVVWIVGLTNAVNIIDGVDGLAAGVTAICSTCMFILCLISNNSLAVIFTASLAGSCLGFLPRNFNPAEIFMGDTGSLFLGYVLAVSSVIGVFKSYAILSIVISVFAMALPILDTSFAMLRRAINKQPIMQADRGHLHHRLIDRGYSQKKTVFLLYALSIMSGALAITIATESIFVAVVVFFSLLACLLMVNIYSNRLNKKK
ncbi:MAG: glycosyltransferase family 4 protein [Lachnospirales bacterium]